MSKHDWIPPSLDDFKIFADNFCSLANANVKPWVLNAANVAVLIDLQTTFNSFYDVSKIKQSRTQQDVQNTTEARVPFEKAIRDMGQHEMKFNAAMTDADRTACGVPNISEEKKEAPVAEVSPVIQYEAAGRLGGKITALMPGTTHSHAKPEGQKAVIVKLGFYEKGGTPPTEFSCTQVELLSHSPQHVFFAETNFGMMFVGYARYVNSRQQPGKVATVFNGIVS